MSVTPDESLPARVQATLPAARARAGEAWARLQESGPRFGSHPLRELLEEEPSDSTAGDQIDVA